ncbi:Activator of stress genes [Penicillium chrysogenum]|uniref:Activator of stress genes n=1 Tax=Penicillium chrysogenum TaxID=5076 RepID=A0A167PWM9_PENCH|nr:Activator of stress genes [Penicillium chrysogenum]
MMSPWSCSLTTLTEHNTTRFPLFHMPSFIEQVNSKKHLYDQGLFASTMAVCSLVAGRARDGALYSNRWDREELIDPPSETFFLAAKDSIPRDLVAAKGIHYMRACAILAIASIQNGQIKDMQKYSGLYHTLTSIDGLHDEKLWPNDLSPVETEERRRLFWSIYTLDLYSTIVWGGVIRYREAHSLVRYPSELDDKLITHCGYGVPSVSLESNSLPTGSLTVASRQPTPWLRGWNFTTDLYRILEHVLDGSRRRFSSATKMTQELWSLFNPLSISEPAVMDQVLTMYSALPSQFRETPPTTGDLSKDLFGFQSANIQATLQLLRMVLLSTEEIGVERKCDVAGELLSVFSNVPIEYLKAISSPLLHHLGGIGYILGSVMEGNLSEVSYRRARTLLLEMADLLQRLEMGLHRASGVGERLRSQVERIDGYMRASFLQDRTSPSNATQVIDSDPELAAPSACAQGTPALGASPGAGLDQMSQFQLPPELLSDWPWPLESHHAEGFLRLAFE